MPMIKIRPGYWRDAALHAQIKTGANSPYSSLATKTAARSTKTPAVAAPQPRNGAAAGRAGSVFPKAPTLDARPAAYQPPAVQHGEAMAIADFLHELKSYRGTMTAAQSALVDQVMERKAQHRQFFW